jgi:hypothetical protein
MAHRGGEPLRMYYDGSSGRLEATGGVARRAPVASDFPMEIRLPDRIRPALFKPDLLV